MFRKIDLQLVSTRAENELINLAADKNGMKNLNVYNAAWTKI